MVTNPRVVSGSLSTVVKAAPSGWRCILETYAFQASMGQKFEPAIAGITMSREGEDFQAVVDDLMWTERPPGTSCTS